MADNYRRRDRSRSRERDGGHYGPSDTVPAPYMGGMGVQAIANLPQLSSAWTVSMEDGGGDDDDDDDD